jgi:peptide/nickel transport system substrate-binding protein
MRHFRPRAYGAMVGAVALTILAAACSSSTSSSGQTTQPLAPGWQGLNPGTGAPQYGGTLNMVGISDVDVMDYDIGYYLTDYEVLRLTVRQLYSWPAIPGHTLTPAPDLATAMPVITDNGLKQTVTIRSGVMWNTSPPRPVTAQDVVRGIKRACNPSPHTFGGMADFESAIKGLTAYCSGYPSAAATNATVMRQYIESHSVSGIAVSGNSITFTLTRAARG